MGEPFQWWLLILGITLGAAITWVLTVRLPRSDADLVAAERTLEAEWISQSIEDQGGYAPPELVDEVLGLHLEYLQGPAFDSRTPVNDRPGTAETAGAARDTES